MALMETDACQFGWQAPDFSLPGVDGKTYSLQDIKGENGTLVMFICNHCPYVKAIIEPLAAEATLLQGQGIGVVAIMPNDTVNYPDDSFENMKLFSQENGFTFPYLIDESQQVARSYDAICTPDFFGFNKDLELQYRGRFDATTPGRQAAANDPRDLLEAMKHIAETGKGPEVQKPSMGCSIKWKAAA